VGRSTKMTQKDEPRPDPRPEAFPGPITLAPADAIGHLYTVGDPPDRVFVDGAFVAALRDYLVGYSISETKRAMFLRFKHRQETVLTLNLILDHTAPGQVGRLFMAAGQENVDTVLEAGAKVVKAGKGQIVPIRLISE
jgi:hypothetical protein